MSDNVQYKKVAPDPAKSCTNCKHYQASAEDEKIGECFGHQVQAQATCEYFETKD